MPRLPPATRPRAATQKLRPTTCPDRPGIDPAELAQRVARHGALNARALTRWLLDEKFATPTPAGLLAPTTRTLALAEMLE